MTVFSHFCRLKSTGQPNWDTLSSSKKTAASFSPAETKDSKVEKLPTNKLDSEKVDSTKMDSVNLDPRSDLSDEDEMLDVLIETFRKMTDENKDLVSDSVDLNSGTPNTRNV